MKLNRVLKDRGGGPLVENYTLTLSSVPSDPR